MTCVGERRRRRRRWLTCFVSLVPPSRPPSRPFSLGQRQLARCQECSLSPRLAHISSSSARSCLIRAALMAPHPERDVLHAFLTGGSVLNCITGGPAGTMPRCFGRPASLRRSSAFSSSTPLPGPAQLPALLGTRTFARQVGTTQVKPSSCLPLACDPRRALCRQPNRLTLEARWFATASPRSGYVLLTYAPSRKC